MQNILIKFMLIVFGIIGLVACSNMYNPMQGGGARVSSPYAKNTTGPLALNGEVGGHIALAMDSIDKSKLSHALDNPLGKSTTWTNQQTGTTFTVTPTQKVVLNENPFCRRYTVLAVKGDQTKQTQGTACVSSDSSWQAVSE